MEFALCRFHMVWRYVLCVNPWQLRNGGTKHKQTKTFAYKNLKSVHERVGFPVLLHVWFLVLSDTFGFEVFVESSSDALFPPGYRLAVSLPFISLILHPSLPLSLPLLQRLCDI